jgi:predicted Zn-dependent protease with MMP-like domain
MDSLRSVLRAAVIAAFAVGLLLFLLQPPDLGGASRLATTLVGAILLILVTAGLTVLLMGKDGPTEEEFERVVLRSEQLAQFPQLAAEATEFELLVADAIDDLPEEFQVLLEDTPVIVSRHGRENRAYGHYFGDTVARGNYEDRIVLYQDTLERDFGYDRDVLRAQVERTLRHELAHHLGWGEEGVRQLGL